MCVGTWYMVRAVRSWHSIALAIAGKSLSPSVKQIRTLLCCLLVGFEGLFLYCTDYGSREYSGGSEGEATAF